MSEFRAGLRVLGLGFSYAFRVLLDWNLKALEFCRLSYVGGCPNYDPFWGIICIIGIQRGTIILTTRPYLEFFKLSATPYFRVSYRARRQMPNWDSDFANFPSSKNRIEIFAGIIQIFARALFKWAKSKLSWT